MSYETGLFPDNVHLNREQRLRQLFAFVVTAVSVFLLLSLFWPLTVNRFRSQTKIIVCVGEEAGAEQEFQSVLAMALRARTTDASLASMIDQVASQASLKNAAMAARDFAKLRRSLSVRTGGVPNDGRVPVEFAIEGGGSFDEQGLIQLFRNEIAAAIITSAEGSEIESELAIEARGSVDVRPQIERVGWLLQQVENDVLAVRDSIDKLLVENGGATPFRAASHSLNSVSLSSGSGDLVQIQQALESIDLASLREQLNHLKNSSYSDWDDSRTDFKLATATKTIPVNAVPGRIQLLWLGITACLIGSVVAVNYGAFAERGFADIGCVASLLRVPVVATLPGSESIGDQKQRRVDLPWANRVVQISKLFLLGIGVLVGGFCSINPAVRNSFLENPFYGFSKLVWVFFG